MKRTYLPILVLAAFALASVSTLRADELLTNGGFENGFTGWGVNVESGSAGNWYVSSSTKRPATGISNVGPAGGSSFALTDSIGQGAYSLVQSFTVAPGQTVLFSFDLFANNYAGSVVTGPLDYKVDPIQFATVDLLTGTANPFDTGSGVIQNFYQGSGPATANPYTSYSFDISSLVAAGGTFQIRFGEADNQNYFNLGVDNVTVIANSATAVPEASTLLLLGTGFGVMGLVKARRRKPGSNH